MAKSDVKNELKVLTELVGSLKADVSELTNTVKTLALSNNKAFLTLEELNQILQNLSIKVDCLNNDSGVIGAAEASAPKPKRPAAKKKTAPEPTTTANTTEVKTPDQTPNTTPNNAVDTTQLAAPVKRAVRRAPAKKATVEEPTTTDEVKQPEVKSVTRKPKAAPVASRPINKMEFFKQQYSADPSYFDEYLTSQVKDAIRKEHKEWAALSGDQLLSEERKAFYAYMKDYYDDQLQAMKSTWIEEQANANIKIVGKETD